MYPAMGVVGAVEKENRDQQQSGDSKRENMNAGCFSRL